VQYLASVIQKIGFGGISGSRASLGEILLVFGGTAAATYFVVWLMKRRTVKQT